MRNTFRTDGAWKDVAVAAAVPRVGSIIVGATLQSLCQLPGGRALVYTDPMDVTITPPSAASAKALERALAAHGVPARLTPAGEGASSFHLVCGDRELELSAPVRLGVLLEKAKALSSPAPVQVLSIGPYSLDLVGKTWSGSGQPLTDREAALLEALILAPGHRLERSALLEHVWGYHKDAETHTLETHIYRLRRKIERDAGEPELLLTDGSGYRLAV